MSMQFTDVVMVYFIVGTVLVIGGPGYIGDGPVGTFVGMNDDGNVEINDELDDPATNTSSGNPGMLGNLMGPLREGASSVFGGGLIAAMASFVVGLLSILGWPVVMTINVGAPWQVQLVASIFVVAMVLGAGKVLRASL